MEGYNGTIFAYGQTSSGKTHTLMGDAAHPGVIPLSVKGIFELIAQDTTHEFLVRVSYIELYNEELKDLLKPDGPKLKVVDDKKLGPRVVGLHDVVVTEHNQVDELLVEGEKHRSYGYTDMNATSSRSHVIFKMILESSVVGAGAANATKIRRTWSTEKSKSGVSIASVYLVDLAGSERQGKTNATGSRLKEGININKSLSTLGIVINKLCDGKGGAHIPYRDSKLTRMLQTSLGGNSRTVMLAAISPAERNREETLSTLAYASRAKRIVNNATKNIIEGSDSKLVQMKGEVEAAMAKNADLEERLRKAEENASSNPEVLAEQERLRAEAEAEREKTDALQKLLLVSAGAAKDLRRKGNIKEAEAIQRKQMQVLMGKRRAASVLQETSQIVFQAHHGAAEGEGDDEGRGRTDSGEAFDFTERYLKPQGEEHEDMHEPDEFTELHTELQR